MRGSMRGAVRGVAVLNLLIVGAGRVGAESLYRLTVLGTLGGTFSQGYAVTASGQVAGEETTPDLKFALIRGPNSPNN
jgi:hypothetical protein